MKKGLRFGIAAAFGMTALIALAQMASAPSRSRTFVTAFGNILKNVQYGLTPAGVAATSDGGYIALAHTDSSNGVSVSWLLKLDGVGRPQWKKEIGCGSGAPGDYSLGTSVLQSLDGGYVIGGGILGCGGAYLQRPLLEKLDAQGQVVWAVSYPAGPQGSGITQIRQTTDGGYIAVGNVAGADLHPGALIFKLDGVGTVQWQRTLDPTGSSGAYFNAVQQTSDGGYVATGEFYMVGQSYPYPTSVLVVAFDPSGNVRWQKAFNNLDNGGAPSGFEHALAGIQTSDGGYLVSGNWYKTAPNPFPQEDSGGALFLKLDSSGNVQWQKEYNGGVFCYFNGYNETCTIITALPYSMRETADGGYVFAGLGILELLDSVPQVPWLAKLDSGGNLLWQYFYYDLYSTGRPISQYFASSTAANDGGFMAVGFTERNDSSLIGELYAVKTDSAGLVAGCGQLHDATPLHTTDPGLSAFSPALPVSSTAGSPSSVQTRPRNTSIAIHSKCAGN